MSNACRQDDLIAHAFNGDRHLSRDIKALVAAFSINLIVETGTYHGDTTAYLCTLVPQVITMEINERAVAIALDKLARHSNIIMMKCTSPIGLRLLALSSWSVLFFLDAHGPEYCPLLDELNAIATKAIRPVIVIHDFKVPGRPDLGYDSYNGQEYEFGWIKPSLDDIYGEGGYRYYYNTLAEGANRGALFATPIFDDGT